MVGLGAAEGEAGEGEEEGHGGARGVPLLRGYPTRRDHLGTAQCRAVAAVEHQREFGGGADKAKEMAAAAAARAAEAKAKKEAEEAARRQADEEASKRAQAEFVARCKAEEAAKAAKGKKAGQTPKQMLQELGYSRKLVDEMLRQANGDEQKALELLQNTQKKFSAMTKDELETKVQEAMRQMDSYGTGVVSFRQLLSWVRRQQGGSRVTDEMLQQGRTLFFKCDPDGNGFLSIEEMSSMMLAMEQDHMFSKVISSFLGTNPDDNVNDGPVIVLTEEQIEEIKHNPDFCDQTNDMIMDYVEAELKKMEVPVIKGKASWGTYELHGVKTKSYNVSANNLTVDTAGRYRIMSTAGVRAGPEITCRLHAQLSECKRADMLLGRSYTQGRTQARHGCQSPRRKRCRWTSSCPNQGRLDVVESGAP